MWKYFERRKKRYANVGYYSPLCMHTRSFMPWVLKDSIWDCVSGPGSRYHGHNSCHINELHKPGLLVWDKYCLTFWKDLSGLNIGLKDFNYICVTLQYQIISQFINSLLFFQLKHKILFCHFCQLIYLLPVCFCPSPPHHQSSGGKK